MKKILLGVVAMTLLACNSSNPLLEQPNTPYGVPAFDKVKLEHYLPAFEAAIAQQKAEVDAIVNAANNTLMGCWNPDHLCVDNLIQSYSGYQTRQACTQYMDEQRKIHGEDYLQPTAVPMMTSAYNLPSEYIIHVVGPIVSSRLTKQNKDELAECYRASLELAAEHGCRNIAFCCISTGVFMFPQDKAAEIAVATVKKWLDEHPESCLKNVIFDVFKDKDLRIYQDLLHVRKNAF